jgi:hypothetical protein
MMGVIGLNIKKLQILFLLDGPPASPEGEADRGQATNIEVGLLLNFGRKPEFKRFVYDNKRKNIGDDQRESVAE